MELIELTPEAYAEAFPTPRSVYASTAFARLNAYKAETVHYLCFTDGSHPRLGIILGESDGELRCPFSAPFGSIDYRQPQHIATIEAFFDALDAMRGSRTLRLTLPPAIYDPQMQPKIAFVAASRCSRCVADINYTFGTELMADYSRAIDSEARRKLRQARAAGFCTVLDADPERAYRVIEQNRKEHGYPLRMTLEQVLDTIRIIPCHCIVLVAPDGCDAAASIVFESAPGIAQVIYWGNLEAYNRLRPMNLLAQEVFADMRRKGFATVDLGPASSDGMANAGLCEFKESVGATASLKLSYFFSV